MTFKVADKAVAKEPQKKRRKKQSVTSINVRKDVLAETKKRMKSGKLHMYVEAEDSVLILNNTPQQTTWINRR